MEKLHIPGFELIEKIGQGGMAVVWKARQVSLDRIVAIKFLKPQMTSQPGEVERMLAEARSAARLKHQGIVQVYDANVIDGVPYIILEYVSGYTVGEWIRRKGQLNEHDTLLIGQCVANALNQAWKTAHIIHCDIKPDNLMVDRDGTIKVADLGLSQTIGPRGTRQPSDEIMGTPNYISPEQSQGNVSLDCRSDIYSLGATLYHLATGRRLFQDHSDTQAMDLQITAQDADPYDINPQLSTAFCALVEKMVAKNREARHPDWDSVLRDIDHVQRGKMIGQPLPKDAISTVKRSAKRPVIRQVQLPKSQSGAFGEVSNTNSPSHVSVVIAWVLVLAAVGFGIRAWIQMSASPAPPPVSMPRARPPAPPPAMVATPPAPNPAPAIVHPNREGARAREIYDAAMTWAQANSNDSRTVYSRFKAVEFDVRGTEYEAMAREVARRYQDMLNRHIQETRRAIFAEAQQWSANGQWIQAAEYLENYQGECADETTTERTTKAAEYRRMASGSEQQQRGAGEQEERRYDEFIREVARLMVSGQVSRAQSLLVESLQTIPWGTRHVDMLSNSLSSVQAAQVMDRKILESFRAQLGKDVVLRLQRGNPITVTIQSVTPTTVCVAQKTAMGATILMEYRMSDLAGAERIQRLGRDESGDVALGKGLVACQAKAFDKAADFFGKAGSPLSEPLVEAARGAKEAYAVQHAIKKDRYAGPAATPSPHTTPGGEDKESVAGRTNGPEGMMVKPMSPDDMERLVSSLCELNLGMNRDSVRPSFDERGFLVKLVIVSKSLINVAPLKELKSLQILVLGPTEEGVGDYQGPPAPLHDLKALSSLSALQRLDLPYTMTDDIRPLRTLRLRSINLRKSAVNDISTLQNSPLEEINVSYTDVKDINCLRGKNLRNVDLGHTKVRDLSPLGGSSKTLVALSVAGESDRSSPVRDIAVLRHMINLRRLNLAHVSVFDFGALRFLPLESLNLEGTAFKELGLCKDMPLKYLNIADTKVGDLSPLSDKELVSLDIRGTMIKELDPLRRMPLKALFMRGSRVRTLAPLRGMELENLDIMNTAVKDISVLEGMPLSSLSISGSEVMDISVFKKLSLKNLRIDTHRIVDYTPMRGMELESIWIDGEVSEKPSLIKELNSMANLRSVNGDEHWRARLNK